MPLVPRILDGVNATCFAYGMTGAGKTHTMLGDLYNTATGEPGVCLMAVEAIFAGLETCTCSSRVLRLSYLEIYNEQVVDLLATSSTGLMIVEDPGKGVTVPGLTEYEVKSPRELIRLMLQGNQKRTMAETSANQFSSRSHAILQVAIEYRVKGGKGNEELVTSKLSLVDLAGSERAATNENRGLRMLEGGKINRSLLALGNCINILSDKAKSGLSFVPYRDSKLTRLLKDSLGGNTKTVMIACIVSTKGAYEETLNTLKYAERAKKIRKKVNRNVREIELDATQYKEIIENLRGEIVSLKENAVRVQLVHSVQGEDIRALDDEILKTKAMKEKAKEELERNNEEVTKSMKMSQVHEDDAYLFKLSQELLSKYEEHYEMKQSVHELTELNQRNAKLLAEHQRRLDELVKEKIVEDLPTARADQVQRLIEDKTREIDSLQAIIENNEQIKRQIEDSLKINAMMQQKYVALVVKLQSHKKKDILDLQIAIRTLRLEKMDLIMQNLESKKAARIAAIMNEGKDKQIAEMRQQIDGIKQSLELKERQLKASELQLEKQNTELAHLRKVRAPYSCWNRSPAASKTPFSFSRTGSIVVTPAGSPSRRTKRAGVACSLPPSPAAKKSPRLPAEDFGQRAQGAKEELEGSFISLSSVSGNVENCEEISKSDIELANTCTDALKRAGVAPMMMAAPEPVETAAASNGKASGRSGSTAKSQNRLGHNKRASVGGVPTVKKKADDGFFSSVNNNYAKAINRFVQKRGSVGKEDRLNRSHMAGPKDRRMVEGEDPKRYRLPEVTAAG